MAAQGDEDQADSNADGDGEGESVDDFLGAGLVAIDKGPDEGGGHAGSDEQYQNTEFSENLTIIHRLSRLIWWLIR